jgi:hypothetical protein
MSSCQAKDAANSTQSSPACQDGSSGRAWLRFSGTWGVVPGHLVWARARGHSAPVGAQGRLPISCPLQRDRGPLRGHAHNQPRDIPSVLDGTGERNKELSRIGCGAPCGGSGLVRVWGIHGLTPEARGVSPLSGLRERSSPHGTAKRRSPRKARGHTGYKPCAISSVPAGWA